MYGDVSVPVVPGGTAGFEAGEDETRPEVSVTFSLSDPDGEDDQQAFAPRVQRKR